MKVLVMGAGALGSILGGFLARAGHSVTLVGRAAHMAAIRDGGLKVTGIWGKHTITGITACTAVDEVAARDFDVVFIAVKSYDTAAAIAQVAPLLGEDTLVVSYQNGLGNAEAIAAVAGWARVVEAMVIFGVHIPALGHVDVTVIARPTALGTYSDGPAEGRVRALAEALDGAALPTVYSDQIAGELWRKVAYNSALNALCALLDVPYGKLPELPETRDMMAAVVAELYAVAAARGVAMDPSLAGGVHDALLREAGAADSGPFRQHARGLPAPPPYGDRRVERRDCAVWGGGGGGLPGEPDDHGAGEGAGAAVSSMSGIGAVRRGTMENVVGVLAWSAWRGWSRDVEWQLCRASCPTA